MLLKLRSIPPRDRLKDGFGARMQRSKLGVGLGKIIQPPVQSTDTSLLGHSQECHAHEVRRADIQEVRGGKNPPFSFALNPLRYLLALRHDFFSWNNVKKTTSFF